MTTEQLTLILLGLGFVPFQIHFDKLKQRHHPRHWHIQAVFWSLTIQRSTGGLRWRLSIPLIRRLRAAIWAALSSLIKR